VVRDGTNGNITIFWNISATGGNSSSSRLMDSDVVPLSGSISMLSGQSLRSWRRAIVSTLKF